LIPALIDAGFDILNPVQCSAAGMEALELKQRFGEQMFFGWRPLIRSGPCPSALLCRFANRYNDAVKFSPATVDSFSIQSIIFNPTLPLKILSAMLEAVKGF